MPLDDDLKQLQEVRTLLEQADQAQKILGAFSQEKIDRIVAAMVHAGYEASKSLAQLAVEETGMGRVESKILKNQFATQSIWEEFAHVKTVGILKVDKNAGVMEVAQPVGVIAGIIPTTNPTSTALFKSIIAVKSGNAIVLSPHPRAVRCTRQAADIMAQAACAAGAPQGLIGCLSFSSLKATQTLMGHEITSMILATGGSGLVKAAYCSGKPAYGVGPGNSPVFIERSASIPHAVRCIVDSQMFDYGTICSSEQSVIIDAPIKEDVFSAFRQNGAYILSPQESRQLENAAFPKGRLNPAIVGKSPEHIAQLAGMTVPSNTTVLIAPQEKIGKQYPLSHEKLSPILSCYIAQNWVDACHFCFELLEIGGMGHTLAIHSTDADVIMEFALKKPTSRILVNAPTAQGGIGSATYLVPSLTLGCGTAGGNITSDNISPLHLIQVKRAAIIREDFPLWENRREGLGGISAEDLVWIEENAPEPSCHVQNVIKSQFGHGGNTINQRNILMQKRQSVFTGGSAIGPPPVHNQVIQQRKRASSPEKSKTPKTKSPY